MPEAGVGASGLRRMWIAVGLTTLAGVVDVVSASSFMLAGLYPIAIVAAAFYRDRRVVWALAATAIVLVYLGAIVDVMPGGSLPWPQLIERTVFAASLVVIALFVDLWIVSRSATERSRLELAARNAALEASNHEISAREEEIARQNEELQSQSEELERQSEELRVTNDELAIRERTLAQLLTLSRLLATELTSDEVMQTVCEWLVDLLGEKVETSARASSAVIATSASATMGRASGAFDTTARSRRW
jgi:cell division protein FtsB